MRPRGEIRQALGQAIAELGGGTWRDVAQRACVGYDAAKETLRNMARAGEVLEHDTVRVPGVARPMVWYRPAGEPAQSSLPFGELTAVMRGWAEFD